MVALLPRALLAAVRFAVLAASASRGAVIRADQVLTPARGIALVTIGAAACLGVSQFVAYRGVEIGAPQYAGVANVAPPPQTDRIDAGAAHAYVLIPLAVLATVLAVLAVWRGRWRLGRLVSIVGLAGIGISLVIDMPKGLDAGTAGIAFEGARATLTNGFYAQIVASAVLVGCGLLLSRAVRAERGAKARRPSRPRKGRRSRRRTALAGGEA